jgi:hypothetical protein
VSSQWERTFSALCKTKICDGNTFKAVQCFSSAFCYLCCSLFNDYHFCVYIMIITSSQCLTTYWTTGVRFSTRTKDFSSLCPYRLWGPPSLLCNGYRGPLPGEERGRCVTLTTHTHLRPRSRMSGSYTSSSLCRLHFDTWTVLLSFISKRGKVQISGNNTYRSKLYSWRD